MRTGISCRNNTPPYSKAIGRRRGPKGAPPKNTRVSRVTPYLKRQVIFMARKKELSKDKRILREEKRLRKNFENIPDELMGVADGLIRRAAYMRVTLEEYEKDILEKGSVEMFTQSEKVEPYERERPVVRLYNQMNKNYQTIIKQLTDMLPKPKAGKAGDEDDGFDDFVRKK